MRKSIILLLLLLLSAPAVRAQRLFVGLEDPSLQTRSTNLAGFPNVSWTNHFAFEVNGAAATPDGELYLCNGPFTTRLYRSTLSGPPVFLTNTSVDLHGLGYGNDTLYGFSNFSSPMGIYTVNTTTGAAVLAVSTATEGYRFFGLDFNPRDGLLYGYTEYGQSGLYSINPQTGAFLRLAPPPPAVNGQGRALAVGNNTVFLLATRGDEGEPCFAYDLNQGPGGLWVGFTNPYPQHHSTGGAAFLPPPAGIEDQGPDGTDAFRLIPSRPSPFVSGGSLAFSLGAPTSVRLEIFDPAGRRVASPFEGERGAGLQLVAWDGRNFRGEPVPAGVYLLRLSAGPEVRHGTLVLTR